MKIPICSENSKITCMKTRKKKKDAGLKRSLFQSDTFFIKVQNAQMTPAIPKWQEPSA